MRINKDKRILKLNNCLKKIFKNKKFKFKYNNNNINQKNKIKKYKIIKIN